VFAVIITFREFHQNCSVFLRSEISTFSRTAVAMDKAEVYASGAAEAAEA